MILSTKTSPTCHGLVVGLDTTIISFPTFWGFVLVSKLQKCFETGVQDRPLYIYIYIYIHTHIHIYVHMVITYRSHICIYTCICMYYIYICFYRYIHILSHMHICTSHRCEVSRVCEGAPSLSCSVFARSRSSSSPRPWSLRGASRGSEQLGPHGGHRDDTKFAQRVMRMYVYILYL